MDICAKTFFGANDICSGGSVWAQIILLHKQKLVKFTDICIKSEHIHIVKKTVQYKLKPLAVRRTIYLETFSMRCCIRKCMYGASMVRIFFTCVVTTKSVGIVFRGYKNTAAKEIFHWHSDTTQGEIENNYFTSIAPTLHKIPLQMLLLASRVLKKRGNWQDVVHGTNKGLDKKEK